VVECHFRGVSNIEALTRTAQMSFPVPTYVPVKLIDQVEIIRFYKTLSEAKGEGGIVGPLART
jgi:hypothetical protein